ncbi:MAG: hypothetical protein U0228_22590 [Myxococcaceae bacterium]
MTTTRIEDASPALRTWAASQSALARRDAPVAGDVLARFRAGPPAWLRGAVAVVAGLAALGTSVRALWFYAHMMRWPVLLGHAALCSAALLVCAWGVGRLLVARSDWRRTWVVTPGSLVHISEGAIKQWPLANVRDVVLVLRRSGANVRLDGESIDLGAALLGGLTWMEGDALAKAIRAGVGGTVTHPPLTSSRSRVGRTAAVALATLATCTVAVFALHSVLEAQVIELLRAEASARAQAKELEVPPAPPVVAAKPSPVVPAAPAAPARTAAPKLAPKPKPAPVAAAPTAPVRLGTPKVVGALPPEIARRVLSSVTPRITECRTTAPAALSGTLQLSLSLTRDGKVTAVAPGPGNTVSDGALSACASKVLLGVTFPAPLDAAAARVDVPYVIASR